MKSLITMLFACSTLITPVFASSAMAHEYSVRGIEIGHPWSRPTPPGTLMGVGYLVIENTRDRDIRLVGASTPRAGGVSIHETLMKDGVMRMQPLKSGLTVPAGGTVELKPHSYHLMLEKLTEPLREAESIPLTLQFEGLESVEVELNVQALDADMEGMEVDHSEHGMEH